MEYNKIIDEMVEAERKYIEQFLTDTKIIEAKVSDFRFKLEAMEDSELLKVYEYSKQDEKSVKNEATGNYQRTKK